VWVSIFGRCTPLFKSSKSYEGRSSDSSGCKRRLLEDWLANSSGRSLLVFWFIDFDGRDGSLELGEAILLARRFHAEFVTMPR
jgi:hypothetical protein